jgi:hypothetical protein
VEFGEPGDVVGIEGERGAVEHRAEAARQKAPPVDRRSRAPAINERNPGRRFRSEFFEFLEGLRRSAIDFVNRNLARRERCERGEQRVERGGNVRDCKRAREALAKDFERLIIFEREVGARVLEARKIGYDRGGFPGAGGCGEKPQGDAGMAFQPSGDAFPIDEGRRRSRQRRQGQCGYGLRSEIGRINVSCPKPFA